MSWIRFFGRFLGFQNSVPQDPPAPLLQRHRAQRITVEGLQFLWLTVEPIEGPQKENQSKFEILNISISGVGFFADRQDFMRSPVTQYSAWLFVGGKKHQVELEVVRQSRGIVGARWIGLSEELRRELWKILEPERVASGSLRMNDSLLAQQPDGKPIFYSSREGCEFYLVTSFEKGLRGYVDWFGSHLQFAVGQPLFIQMIGKKIAEVRKPPAPSEGDLYEWVTWDATRQERAELIAQVVRYIRALPGLEEKLRRQAIGLLESS
jgi:hypothetical protein